MTKQNCLICDRNTKQYTYICNDCKSLLDEKQERVVNKFKYVDEAFSCFYYNSFIKEIILKYKFSNKRYLSFLLSELLIEKIFKEGLHKKIDVLISVPIHKDTLVQRGYNQIDLLEEIIEKEIKILTSKSNLIKTKLTKEQARLSELDRRTNLKNVFEVKRSEEIKDKTVLLLDDIITTGSTIEECSKVLKENGAKKVIALSVATIS